MMCSGSSLLFYGLPVARAKCRVALLCCFCEFCLLACVFWVDPRCLMGFLRWHPQLSVSSCAPSPPARILVWPKHRRKVVLFTILLLGPEKQNNLNKSAACAQSNADRRIVFRWLCLPMWSWSKSARFWARVHSMVSRVFRTLHPEPELITNFLPPLKRDQVHLTQIFCPVMINSVSSRSRLVLKRRFEGVK